MKRRLSMILLPLVAATLVGCGTVSDTDIAASVGDAEYSYDDLATALEDLGANSDELENADISRAQLTAWIGERVADSTDPVQSQEAYRDGIFVSGSLCLAILVAPTEATAEASLEALDAGTPFTEVFATTNVDPSLAATEGRQGCFPIADLPIGTGNALVETVINLTADNPHAIAYLRGDTAETDVYVVSRFIPYQELGPDEAALVDSSLGAEALGLDVYVDPRIGSYDGRSRLVVPLG